MEGKEFRQGPAGLRQRKAALTRLGLLNALIDRLENRTFDEISVRELCKEVGVSEPTFFNYFGSKHELLVFYVKLWSVEMQHRTRTDTRSAFAAMNELFSNTAEAVTRTPRLMYEIISYQVRNYPASSMSLPTRAEITLRFADIPEAAGYAPLPIGAIVRGILQRAVQSGELPGSMDAAGAESLIVSLFFGAPAAHPDARDVTSAYSRGLRTIWRGLGGNPTRDRKISLKSHKEARGTIHANTRT